MNKSDDSLERKLLLDLTKQVRELTGKVNTLLCQSGSYTEGIGDHQQFIREPWDVYMLSDEEKHCIESTTTDPIWTTPIGLHVVRWLRAQAHLPADARRDCYESVLQKVAKAEKYDNVQELEDMLKESDDLDKGLSLNEGAF